MMNSERLSGVRLSDTEVHAVIERALAIDSRTADVSIADLSSAARDVGISEGALADALAQVLANRQRSHSEGWTNWFRPDVLRPAAFAAAGVVGGLVSGGPAMLIVLGLLGVTSAFRAFDNRRAGSQRRFQLEVSALWGGFGLGVAAITTGYIHQDTVGIISSMWIASAAIGGLIVFSGRRRDVASRSQSVSTASDS